MKRSTGNLVTTLALVAALAAVSVVAACGSDDEEGSSNRGAGAGNQPVSADEREILAAVEQMRAALVEKDAGAACGVMAAVQRRYFTKQGGGGSCQKSLGTLFENDTFAENPTHRVVSVRVRGNTATAEARTKGEASLQQATFVKERNEWKVQVWFTATNAGGDGG